MHLTPGTRLGPYEVQAPLGAGGMGEVYRAHDTKLGRAVALKTLPDHFARDPGRLARFQREAHVLASLNHPNIAVIHGLEEADGVHALVLELVEGPTLADIIAARRPEGLRLPEPGSRTLPEQGSRRPLGLRTAAPGLPIEEALPIARQIADALEAAHEQGIIHRDLKPANIKIRPDGTVKVLDFGLAKIFDPVGVGGREGSDDVALGQSPTITSPATQAGVILGTAAYMAPEQAKGKAADKRADIWAFGCVLFEMLTGQRAFAGSDVSEVLAAVIKIEPDWTTLPADTPAGIRRLLRRCLAKDRRERLHDIGDARLEMREAEYEGELPAKEIAATAPRHRERLAWSVAGVLLIAASLASTIAVLQRARDDAPALRTSILTPAALGPAAPDGRLALSPDGRHLAFVAPGPDGRRMLWVRSLDSVVARPLAGTDTAISPFWSPDSRVIAFFADRQLKKIDVVAGGPAITLVDDPTLFPPMGPTSLVTQVSGGSWGRDDVILFGRSGIPGGLSRVSASGGAVSPVTTADPERGEIRHAAPFFLPDGQHFLYTAAGRQSGTVYVGSLDGTLKKPVLGGIANAKYTNALVVIARGSTLFAQAFDERRLELTGDAAPVADDVASNQNNLAAFSVSDTGILAYETGGQVEMDARTLVWVDREGREEPLALEADTYAAPRVSPDGTRFVVSRVDSDGSEDVWVYDLLRGASTRLSFGPAHDTPMWTADGKRVVFRRLGEGLAWAAADGTGEIEILRTTPYNAGAFSRAPGSLLVFMENFPETSWDVYAMPLDGERAVQPLLQSPFEEMRPALSPDGRWLAYSSNESGEHRIYVRPFPDVNDGKWTISSSVGTSPVWGPDGQELFFKSGNTMMRVPTSTSPGFSPGPPEALFEFPFLPEIVGARFGRSYDIAPDGQRFLIAKPAAGGATAASSHIVVVVNGLGR